MADYSMSRDASPPVRLFSVPPLAWLTLLLWFRWPSLFMFMFCIALIAFFAILTRMGDHRRRARPETCSSPARHPHQRTSLVVP